MYHNAAYDIKLSDYYMIINQVVYICPFFQKENEKAVDELRKFYSAQAVKHKENMEQAVNHKVSGLQPVLSYYYDNCIIIRDCQRETGGLNRAVLC